MAVHILDTRFQLAPPYEHYFTFSIDVAATLELYCDGGDEGMLKRLDGFQDRKYAGQCLEIEKPDKEQPKYHVICIRPVQQGLTKAHPRKPDYARPTMCVPILPETAHPKSREPLTLSKLLPWDHCYHPTCYDLWARVRTEWRDYHDSPRAQFSESLCEALEEDGRYRQLLRAGLDDARIQRILDGQEDAPDTDDASEIDGRTCKTFLAKVPEFDDPEEDGIFVPVMRINHILSNVPEISDPSQLCGDVDLFREIVQEHQLARYGSVLFDPPEEPEVDDTSVADDFSFTYSITPGGSYSSLTEELGSDRPDTHELDSTSEESPPVSEPIRKGKWRVKSLLRRAMRNFVELVKWRKFSSKL
ncbi:uncharacterized protein EV420DRAFT_1104445 [Desarmillaria tabescens]|uniref:Uncharacterized protein n=1 Tax=Armillaria tabescens TaxID=1929756 RepID=A0AA39NDP3_ARMTA|nr:uncharacterized protein EV420DRAFT_1104445 [Desarmillaria tabescens]KAK0463715.1 hypothetical protein EV420DRAFT_1104445 [Desarmillaria tabescens]